jgi:taurine dioxygenase
MMKALPGAEFGVELIPNVSAQALVTQFEHDPKPLLDAFYEAHGLMVIKAMHDISDDPSLLVRLSQLFGLEVEKFHRNLTPERLIHSQLPEAVTSHCRDSIFVVSDLPPMSFPVPDQPDPPTMPDGQLPMQFPHRKGWHTDQSFRRPPPDVSLLYAVQPSPKGQGQTLYADGTAAYSSLSQEMQQTVAELSAIHAIPWTGRGEDAVRAGEISTPLKPHQASQAQPIVRIHPVTGQPALYLCEELQLDWILGPVVDMETGPDGAGGRLIYELMTHYTQPQFTYAHDWDAGDLVINDNRNLIHSATWYDAEQHSRIMWRTTVIGNAGDEYDV